MCINIYFTIYTLSLCFPLYMRLQASQILPNTNNFVKDSISKCQYLMGTKDLYYYTIVFKILQYINRYKCMNDVQIILSNILYSDYPKLQPQVD